jgi:predicted nucleotidyltransferase
MLSSKLVDIIKKYAQEFSVKSVWLFGSSLEDEDIATDIDLAVEGLAHEKFFDFYGRLYFEMPKPLDLIELEQKTPIAAIVREKGIRIYER